MPSMVTKSSYYYYCYYYYYYYYSYSYSYYYTVDGDEVLGVLGDDLGVGVGRVDQVAVAHRGASDEDLAAPHAHLVRVRVRG